MHLGGYGATGSDPDDRCWAAETTYITFGLDDRSRLQPAQGGDISTVPANNVEFYFFALYLTNWKFAKRVGIPRYGPVRLRHVMHARTNPSKLTVRFKYNSV